MAREDTMVAVRPQPGQQFKTRVPEDLHGRLKAAAAENHRSTNAELVARLEASFGLGVDHMAKQDDYARYTIRVPADLYSRIGTAAGPKSINAEIIARLEASFVVGDHALDTQIAQLIEAHVEQRVQQRLRAIASQIAGGS